jgi:hypothetical protein
VRARRADEPVRAAADELGRRVAEVDLRWGCGQDGEGLGTVSQHRKPGQAVGAGSGSRLVGAGSGSRQSWDSQLVGV